MSLDLGNMFGLKKLKDVVSKVGGAPETLGKMKEQVFSGGGSFFSKAWEKMKSAKVEGNVMKRFMKKAEVVFTAMVTELVAPQKKEKEASKEAAAEGSKLTQKFEGVHKAIKDLENFEKGSPKEAWSGLTKVSKKAKGEKTEHMTYLETSNLAAFGFKELKKLKDQTKNSDELAAKFGEIEKSSAGMNLPVDKVMSASVLSLMKPAGESGSKEYEDGKQQLGIKLLTDFNVPPTEWTKAADLLPEIGEKNMKNSGEVVAFVGKYMLPNTSDVAGVLAIVAELANDDMSKTARYKKIADLAYLLGDDDYEHIFSSFMGKPKAKQAPKKAA